MTEHNHDADRPVGETLESPSAESETTTETAPPAKADDGPVRRALIRATLKPGDGVPPTPRQAPVFTSHQQTRGGGTGRGPSRNNRPFYDNDDSKRKGNGLLRRQNDSERGGSRPPSSRRGKGRSR